MWYLTVSATMFCYWLGVFLSDDSTPKNHLPSWLIILIAPLLWPIAIPASIIELSIKSNSEPHPLDILDAPRHS